MPEQIDGLSCFVLLRKLTSIHAALFFSSMSIVQITVNQLVSYPLAVACRVLYSLAPLVPQCDWYCDLLLIFCRKLLMNPRERDRRLAISGISSLFNLR